MTESLNPRELALLNSLETEYERVMEKRAAAMAMLMASHGLGDKDTINLKTGEISRE